MTKEKRKVFYTELSYVLGLISMALGAAFTAAASFGMSMIVAPAYILHLKLSLVLPWFSFGIAEYCVQAFLVILTALLMRRFKLSYLFSFVTALLYGALLDGAVLIVNLLPSGALSLRILWFVTGTLLCSLGVSFFFHTYLAPEAYELVVKEISGKFKFNVNRVKLAYDGASLIASVILSFSFFGFGAFRGIGVGTVISAFVNSVLIGAFSRLFEKRFVFKNKFGLERFFN